MKLRPRYSLLTLLLLTALVAGGVKLWHGPHHVVEPDLPNWQQEYSYTLDWRGNRTKHGPIVKRRFQGTQLASIAIGYFRLGADTRWSYIAWIKNVYTGPERIARSHEPCPLSPAELSEFQQARDEELRQIVETGLDYETKYEGMWAY